MGRQWLHRPDSDGMASHSRRGDALNLATASPGCMEQIIKFQECETLYVVEAPKRENTYSAVAPKRENGGAEE